MLGRREPTPLFEEGFALVLLRDNVEDTLTVWTVVHRTRQQLIILRLQTIRAVFILLDAT